MNRDSNHDRHGRLRQVHKVKEICNNFNGVRDCTKSLCSFLHICIKCRKCGHGEGPCETDSSDKTKKAE